MLEFCGSGTDCDHLVNAFFPGLRDSSPITTERMDFSLPLAPRHGEGLPDPQLDRAVLDTNGVY